MKITISIIAIALAIVSCQPKQEKSSDSNSSSDSLYNKAVELAHKVIITDGHVDLPYRLKEDNFDLENDKDILINTEKGDFDYDRAKKGGLDAPFMSIYIPASYQETGGALELADSLIAMVKDIANTYPDKFAVATSPAEVEAQFKKGLISLPMGMENGAPIGDKLENVAYYHDKGIRYITLTHSKDNLICDSSYDTTRTWNGLSPFGREVVKEMNNVGIMIDVAHISDSTFYQVMEISEAPVIASHSSCRHFTPGFERNMSDDMIKLMAENGGVIQINFGSTFLDQTSMDRWNEIKARLEADSIDRNSPEGKKRIDEFNKSTPVHTNVERAADHIDHVVKLVGIDHVGLGSDFDGVGDTLPTGLKDVSQYPNLIKELLKRGYSESDIEKICYKNVFRVWNQVEQVASQN